MAYGLSATWLKHRRNTQDNPKTEDTVADFLMPGDKFPNLTLKTVDSGDVILPDDCAGDWAFIMVYRGHW